jgi:hypothetical protein
MNSFNVMTVTSFDQINTNSFNDQSDLTKSSDENQISFSSNTDFGQSTLINEILFVKDEWLNVNESNKKDPKTSSIFWRKINGKINLFFK